MFKKKSFETARAKVVFYTPDALPVIQTTVSTLWRQIFLSIYR